jgi:hypothetical protein
MKTKDMKKKPLTLALIFATAIAAVAQTGGGQIAFKDTKLDLAYKNYLQLKDALVASKADAAKDAAGKLKASLATLSDSKNVIAEATKIANSASLADIRKTFATLSTEMTALVRSGGLKKGILYLEYCPMANNNQGAFWISSEREIRNPYFGDKMLRCGSVKEMIH